MEFKTSSQESHTLQLSSSSTATTTTTSSSPQQSSMVRGVTIDLEKAIETLFNRWICSGGGVKIISGSDIESPRTFIEKEIRELDPASATLFGNLVQQYTNRNKILDRSDSSFTEIIASNTAWKEDQKNQQQQGLETQAAAGGGTETSAADDAVSTNPSTTTTSVLPTTTSSNNILPLEVSGEKDNFSIKSQDDVEINKVEVEGGDDGNLMVGVTKTSTTTTASPSPPPSAVLTLQLLENVTDDEKSLADSIQMISEPRVVDSVMEDGQDPYEKREDLTGTFNMLDIEKKAASAASSVELAAATTDTVMEPFSPAAEDHAMTDVPQELHDSFSSSVHEHVYKKKDSAVDLNEPMRIDSIHIPPPLDQQPQQSHHLHLTSISPTSSSFSSVSISNNKHILQNSSSAVNLSTKTSSAVIARFYIPKSDAKKLNEELCKTVKERISTLFNRPKNSSFEDISKFETSSVASNSSTEQAENTPSASPILPSSSLLTMPLQSSESISLDEREFMNITKALGIPIYLNRALFFKCKSQKYSTVQEPVPMHVNFAEFCYTWDKLMERSIDDIALVFYILADRSNDFITPDDLEVVLNDVVENHPGLEFLITMPLFQSKYVETVIARIFFTKQNSFNEKMTLAEFKKSQFIDLLRNIEEEPDINKSRDLFSYKHFYVIYCKFWELDEDHDMFIEEAMFNRYERSSISDRVIKRIFDGAGRPLSCFPVTSPRFKSDERIEATRNRRMGYLDFIYFILANEHKMLPTSIEYWFRVLDTDGDGVLSLWEIRCFWEEQFDRMIGREMSDPWKFEDFVCGLIDLVRPRDPNRITISDLKKTPNAGLFFDMIFDIQKYECTMRRIDPIFREMDDIFILNKMGERVKLEGWEKFAERAYEELALEESREAGATYRSAYSEEYDLADWDSELAYGRIVEGEVDAAEQSHLPAEESEDASSSSDVEMDATSSSRDDEESAE